MGICFSSDDEQEAPRAPRQQRVRTATPASPIVGRQRRDAPAGSRPVEQVRSPPQQIGSAPRANMEAQVHGSLLGTSYTDRREAETDELMSIMQTTQEKFLDIQSKPAPLDRHDVALRAQQYKQQLQALDQTAQVDLFQLPRSAVQGDAQLVEVLSADAIPTDEWDAAHDVAERVALAVARIQVEPVGSLVVPITEL